jgi:hypothetical protein
MSAPYRIQIADYTTEPIDNLAEAIETARESGGRIIGDDYDCDFEDGQYFECSDGLTEEEREAIAGAGLP